MKPNNSSMRTRAGFSLVLSLIILTLLSILVIGFVSTTAFDRTTAHAFANKTRAELAAETAVNSAMSLIAGNIAEFPDSATVWESLTPKGGGEDVEGTMLYYSDTLPNDPTAQKHVLPLLSTGVDSNGLPRGAVPLAEKSDALGMEAWNNDNSIDLNHARDNNDLAGWIGSPIPLEAEPKRPKPRRAKWIEVKDAPTDGKTPRTVGRYAFWVEDESFKVNLNLLGTTPRGTDTAGTTAAEIPLQGLLRNAYTGSSDADWDIMAKQIFDVRQSFPGKRLLDLRSFNQIQSGHALGDETKFYGTIFSGGLNLSRAGSQRLNLNGLNIKDESEQSDSEISNQLRQIVETIRFKYHAPKFGQRFYRLDEPPTSSSPAVQEAYRAKVNKNNTVLSPHETIYLHKVAANIRDYIDPDHMPTIIKAPAGDDPAAWTLGVRTAPVTALSSEEGENEAWAQGKEATPFLQEAAVRIKGGVLGSPAATSFSLTTDYYLEFWNMSDKDIPASKLGTNPFVRVSNAPGWREIRKQTGNTTKQILGQNLKATNLPAGDPDEGRTFIIYLQSAPGKRILQDGVPVAEVVFSAGACTVITNDPDAFNSNKIGEIYGGTNAKTTFLSENVSGKRVFTGATEGDKLAPSPKTYTYGINFILGRLNAGTETSDYSTEVVLGSDRGYLDSHPFAVAIANPAAFTDSSEEKVFGGSLLGNSVVSQLGDPRTNSEQLKIKAYKAGGVATEPNQTRYANPPTDKPQFSLGWPNSRFVNPQGVNAAGTTCIRWSDYYKGWEPTGPNEEQQPNPDATRAPAFVLDLPMSSIGQLGDIFDPARRLNPQGTLGGIEYSRGGGRTLKIGQPDDLIFLSDIVGSGDSGSSENGSGPSATNKSRGWAAWRLCDFLSTTGRLNLPGLININGVRRDNGAAFRAATYGMRLHAVSRGTKTTLKDMFRSDVDIKSEDNAATGVQRVITQALDRMNRNDPARTYNPKKAYFGAFMERGELSELGIFNGTTDPDGADQSSDKLLTNVKMDEAFDRTREEFFNRLVELVTTRGSVFSIYAIGQSIQELSSTAAAPRGNPTLKVTGTHQTKVTFQLVPKKADGSNFLDPAEDKDDRLETFSPVTSDSRFAKPDHYDVQILQVSS